VMIIFFLVSLLHITSGICPKQCMCDSDTVKCGETGSLNNVPHFLNPSIVHLDLSGNMIVKLEGNIKWYRELKFLNLSENEIRYLGRDQFMEQQKLTTLDISHNMLSKLRSGAFYGLEGLLAMNLQYNEIKKLDPEVFTGLIALETLDLSFNPITEILPGAFKHLNKLTNLILRKNKLSVLSDWSLPLPNLQKLDLSQNLLIRIEESECFPNLSKLDLSDNMLSEIEQKPINKMASLKSLDISYNKLTDVPRMSNLKLEVLILSGNMIKSLEQNSLAGVCSSLENIRLNNMPLLHSLAPLALIDCHNLQELSLANNPKLATLPKHLFHTTPKLEFLDLSYNRWNNMQPEQVPVAPKKIILTGINLQCDCSLVWMWELEKKRPGLLLGAKCDGTFLEDLNIDLLACQQVDNLLVITIVGAVIAFVIVIAIVVTFVKCWRDRSQTDPHKFTQCDYLQYSPAAGDTFPPVKPYYSDKQPDPQYLQQSPQKLVFSDKVVITNIGNDQMFESQGGYESEQIYYCVQDPETDQVPKVTGYDNHPVVQDLTHQVYSSGSATSSDHATSSSTTECSLPCSKSYNGSPIVFQGDERYFGTKKKNTFVQYKFPDVLPHGKVSQNYYV